VRPHRLRKSQAITPTAWGVSSQRMPRQCRCAPAWAITVSSLDTTGDASTVAPRAEDQATYGLIGLEPAFHRALNSAGGTTIPLVDGAGLIGVLGGEAGRPAIFYKF